MAKTVQAALSLQTMAVTDTGVMSQDTYFSDIRQEAGTFIHLISHKKLAVCYS